MTPQEEQLLNSLTERVNQTQLQEKDPDAEALLNRELGGNQDALYILAQSVLVQNIALEQAKAQVTQLQQQVQQARQQPARATSFLGNLLGHRDPAPPPPQPTYLPPQQGYVPPPPPPPGYVDPQYSSNTLQRASRASCAGPCRRLRAWRLERLLLKAWSRSCMGLVDSDIPDLDGVEELEWAWAVSAWGREWG